MLMFRGKRCLRLRCFIVQREDDVSLYSQVQSKVVTQLWCGGGAEGDGARFEPTGTVRNCSPF
jgi:hypothetical protein